MKASKGLDMTNTKVEWMITEREKNNNKKHGHRIDKWSVISLGSTPDNERKTLRILVLMYG